MTLTRVFFFQAEDGIRYVAVTGVQTCALPIFGRDQLPHLEVTRTVARRFNTRYRPTFTEPRALISEAPAVLGADGHKMSKSRGNAIALRDSADTTAAIIKGFKTDSERHITFDP